ncbi:hypothetical protein DOJK_00544 [Patescibacteria group bacterium]|jgi:hypothetical protein|nr:hypothetical protein DOJK_00544 [Patescibacteria group bacterium]
MTDGKSIELNTDKVEYEMPVYQDSVVLTGWIIVWMAAGLLMWLLCGGLFFLVRYLLT